jgi:hypothetical protein
MLPHDTHLGEAFHIAACLRIANFSAFNRWNDRSKRDNMVYTTPSGESWSVVPEIVEGWKNQTIARN